MSHPIELSITALAAGGDGVGRDASGRVTFVPRTCPGDVVRARVVQSTRSFARAQLVSLLAPGSARVQAPCPHFERGCGGCQWQHVERTAQLAAKTDILAGAFRKLPGLTLHPVDDATPSYQWRRRARFHVAGGVVGLYALGTHRVLPIDRCPQLEPALEEALQRVLLLSPPDGELAFLLSEAGEIVIGIEHAWNRASVLVGDASIVGVVAGGKAHGKTVIEVEPGLYGGPWEFAQASLAGNASLIERVRAVVGEGPGRALELYAGAGNLTRALVADQWSVVVSDVVAPIKASNVEAAGRVKRLVGDVAQVLSTVAGPFELVVLDPPRTGAAEAIPGLLRLLPPRIVYVSCDAATLARDAEQLCASGYRATDAWPIDLMPQTAHVEVVMALVHPEPRTMLRRGSP